MLVSKNPITLDTKKLDGNAINLLLAFSIQAKQEGWLQEEINIVTSEAVKGDYKTLLSIILQHTTNESLPSEDSEALKN
jgi:hypothetical protein